MAELAIPLLLLGSLYVASNRPEKCKKKDIKEGFVNNNNSLNNLPNTQVITPNFPVSNQPIERTSENYTRQYLNPNQTTDKFFNKDITLRDITSQSKNQEFESLSGNNLTPVDFRHNNMVPFFGSRVTQQSADRDIPSILDNTQGAGTQLNSKVEIAPLFNPEDNVQFTHGMPNSSDFFASRQLPSTTVNNVLPWKQERVGPGLGLGYTTGGDGGFNAGMMQRDAWKPPTVDDLRVKTNPRESFNLLGHEGPASSQIKQMGTLGTVEKNRPDTLCEVGPQRWFTTTGASTGPMSQAEQMMPDTNKCTTEYYGDGGNQQGMYVPGHTEDPHKSDSTLCTNTNPAVAIGYGSNKDDHGRGGYNILPNNRSVSCQSKNNSAVGIINSTVKAMMSPVMDALRPSRKENVIYNANQLGNIQANVPNLPLTNPLDKPKTTNKEMTGDKIGLNYLNVSHMGAAPEGAYQNTNIMVKSQQRNFGDCGSMGNVGNTMVAPMDISAWNEQHNNVNKTHKNWPMPGGTQLFSGQTNMTISKKDNDRVNNRLTTDDFIRTAPNNSAINIPCAESLGKITMPQQYSEEHNNDRINPNILQAFKSNPYAQSLQSY